MRGYLYWGRCDIRTDKLRELRGGFAPTAGLTGVALFAGRGASWVAGGPAKPDDQRTGRSCLGTAAGVPYWTIPPTGDNGRPAGR